MKKYYFNNKPYLALDNFTFVDESDTREALWRIQPNDCIFDIGAAIGSYTLTAFVAGAKQAFAWDPSASINDISQNKKELEQCLEANEWLHKCVVYDYGIYDQAGWLDTEKYSMRMVATKLSSHVIPVKPLDEWYNEIFKTHYGQEKYNNYWLKIDVESAELGVLKSAETLIKELKPYILIENHQFVRNTICQECIDYVLSLGIHKLECVRPHHYVSHSLFTPMI